MDASCGRGNEELEGQGVLDNTLVFFAGDNGYFHGEHASSGIKLPASEALVRMDWKFFFWPESKLEQLFHVAEDTHGEIDLAGDPAHAERLAEMRARFSELKASAK